MDLELWVTVAAAAGGANVGARGGYHGYSLGSSSSGVFESDQATARGQGNRTGGGVCFAFNRPKGCQFVMCKFAHRCSGCEKFGHGVHNCRLANQPRMGNRAINSNGGRTFGRSPYPARAQLRQAQPAIASAADARPGVPPRKQANFRAPLSS